MQSWASLPWVQYGLAPFLAGLITAELLQRLRLSGLAPLAGIAITAWMLGGYDFPAAGTTYRLLIACAAGALLGVCLEPFGRHRRLTIALAAAFALAAWLWMALSTIRAKPLTEMLLFCAVTLAYATWVGAAGHAAAHASPRAGAFGVAAGAAAGALLALSGQAELAKLAYALAAASSAYQLIQLVSNTRLPAGSTAGLCIGAIATLLPLAATLGGRMPLYFLGLLALIPAACLVPVSERMAPGLQALVQLLIAGVSAAAVIGIGYMLAGAR